MRSRRWKRGSRRWSPCRSLPTCRRNRRHRCAATPLAATPAAQRASAQAGRRQSRSRPARPSPPLPAKADPARKAADCCGRNPRDRRRGRGRLYLWFPALVGQALSRSADQAEGICRQEPVTQARQLCPEFAWSRLSRRRQARARVASLSTTITRRCRAASAPRKASTGSAIR